MPSPPPVAPRRARLPALLLVLAIPSLCMGLLGLFLGFTELSGAMQDRHSAVTRMRDAQLLLYDSKRLVPALQKLPRAEIERLALLLGDERFERRGVALPLSLLSIVASWLLLTGATGTLRRQELAPPLWRFACLVNLPLLGLQLIVTLVQVRELGYRLGPPLSEALGKVSGRGAAAELSDLWALERLYVTGWGMLYGVLVLLLSATVLALSLHLKAEREV